jgi:hypothetical protein
MVDYDMLNLGNLACFVLLTINSIKKGTDHYVTEWLKIILPSVFYDEALWGLDFA